MCAAEPGIQARGVGLPNSAGIIIDAIRAAKIGRTVESAARSCRPRRTFQKSPPVQYSDSEARDSIEAFIRGDIER